MAKFAPPRMALGCAPMGGLFRASDDDSAQDLVETALSLGISHFDTAPLYGSGESERRLGLGLRGRNRDTFTVSTKVGRLLEPGQPDETWIGAPGLKPTFGWSHDDVHRSLEASLQRLQLDRVELVLLHDPVGHFDQALNEALPALLELRDQGVIDAVGLGSNIAALAERFVAAGGLDAVLIAGRLTLLDASAQSVLLDAASDAKIHVICGGVFNSGILTGAKGAGTFDYSGASREVQMRVSAIEAILKPAGSTLMEAAIQFPLLFPGVSGIVVGAHNSEELQHDFEALHSTVPREVWLELAEAGLLPAAIPQPTARTTLRTEPRATSQ